MPSKPRRKGPAHQNTFAFKHNPNSKLTAKILSLPIEHVCRRCRDKIEWRKQYRKYKPRTQPGKCNCCQMKRVTAAYHTICEPCTRNSSKARTLLDEWNRTGAPTSAEVEDENDRSETKEDETKEEVVATEGSNNDHAAGGEADTTAAAESVEQGGEEEEDEPRRVYRRICAMCVKEPALASGSDEEYEVDDKLKNLDRPLRLRERKRLERLAEKKPTRRRTREENEENEEEELPQQEAEEEEDDDEQDPLLQAVGGADRLLTGEAYQAKLLQQASQT